MFSLKHLSIDTVAVDSAPALPLKLSKMPVFGK